MRTRTMVCALVLAFIVSAQPAFAGQTTVGSSHAGVVTVPITVMQLAPPACSGLNLTTVVTADGNGDTGKGGGNGNGGNGRGGGNAGGTDVTTVRGTNGNDLLLGTSGADLLDGRKGTDCLVGGAGADSLDGGQDNDVCIVGAPEDTTSRCETVV